MALDHTQSVAQQLYAIGQLLQGSLSYLGTITGAGGTAIDNTSTATPFVIPAGAALVIQTDVAVYWTQSPATSGGATVPTTAAIGHKVPAAGSQPVMMKNFQNILSVISVSGAFNVKVFQAGDGT